MTTTTFIRVNLEDVVTMRTTLKDAFIKKHKEFENVPVTDRLMFAELVRYALK